MAATKKVNPPPQESSQNVGFGFYKESMAKEKKFILGQLRDNANLPEANPFTRIMHMNPDDVPIDLGRPKTVSNLPISVSDSLSRSPHSNYTSRKKTDYVHDKGGEFLLTRGTLPSSIPGRYNTKHKIVDWKSLQSRHEQLQKELNEVNSLIQKKEIDMSEKMKQADPSVRSMSALNRRNNSRLLHNPMKVSSIVQGYGYQWKGTQQRQTSLYGLDNTLLDTAQCETLLNQKKSTATGLWGELTKGCDLPQKSLYLRSEPFVPKIKRATTLLPPSTPTGFS